MAIQDPSNLLARIDWQTRQMFGKLASELEKHGLDLRVRSGLRTCAEQDALYAQGRTAPGPIVTDAAGCISWHVAGRAIDADPVVRSTGLVATIASGAYQLAGQIWERLGGKWGGRFDFQDYGHFEWHPGLTIASVCPNASACATTQRQIATVAPLIPTSPWAVAMGAFLFVGAALYVKYG